MSAPRLVMMPKSYKRRLCQTFGLRLLASKRRSHVDREIAELQRSAALIIPASPFARATRALLRTHPTPLRLDPAATDALHHAAEAYLVRLFQEANLLALHARRQTVMERDLWLAFRLTDSPN